jgi:hypothetical protein
MDFALRNRDQYAMIIEKRERGDDALLIHTSDRIFSGVSFIWPGKDHFDRRPGHDVP